MIYEVIRKMAWNKFQCFNGLLRLYVQLVVRFPKNAIPLKFKNTVPAVTTTGSLRAPGQKYHHRKSLELNVHMWPH